MISGFAFSDDNKRYYTLNYHNKHVYGCRVYKATVDAGLSCPHIGNGGCVFCARTPRDTRPIREQFNAEKERILKKDPNAKILMYYGIGTNTFCGAERLSELLCEARDCGAFAMSTATRPDCLDSEKARILSEFSAEYGLPLTVELGLQTVHDETARIINRGHTYADFLNGYNLLKEYKIRVCVHIIDGLPGENALMMLETARKVGLLRPDGLKIHSAHVLRGTRLCEMYKNGEYVPLEREEYIDTVARQLELIPPETVIERVTGDGDKSLLEAPLWSRDKIAVLGGLDKRMAELDTFQGRLFTERDNAEGQGSV